MTDTLDIETEPLALDPDRLFPEGKASRAVARELYGEVADAPIVSPHGHVDPNMLLDDEPFRDAFDLFIRYDHYVTRLLHASGVPYGEIYGEKADPRAAWRTFCAHWDAYQATASGYWLRHELGELFGATEEPSAASADRLFDLIQRRLAEPDFRPRALFNRFRIDTLATTDDPLDDLAAHVELKTSGALHGRVIPTFRPDAYMDPTKPGYAERVEALTATVAGAADDYAAYLEAFRARRAFFIDRGAVSADHGVETMATLDLDPDDAAALFRRTVAGEASEAESRAFTAHMLTQMAGMSVDDGLVMTVHPGVLRNHDEGAFRAYGADTGHDIPIAAEYTRNLRPLLARHGNAAGFHLVLFTIDETSFSREIAPLAGYYPSVFVGAPWWFLDAPDAVQRFRAASTETAGLTKGSGFIDDTRAFLSIPARHDMARRTDAAYLARLVGEGRMPLIAARRMIVRMTEQQPREVFKL
ncbi:glucuronate isomerase [Microbacterium halophytorum]|uniref:glucuronate isomerase n=1 Tax=Microbacterium halophytorum TaxID=2067568 RepID=UPI000CFBB3CF|nr:glucuronate isomerase [Microbacterium halophytorum]